MPLRRVIACLYVFVLLIVWTGPLAAEDTPTTTGATPPTGAPSTQDAPATEKAGSGEEPNLQRDALSIELSTAGYYELVARARELGLSDSGGAEELRARLSEHYGIKALPSAAAKGRIVTIERAGQASYAKVEDEEGGIVRAYGGVILTLVETNGDSHRIQADSIAFDRARSTLTARGNVHYERKSGTSTEIFSGEALSADLDDWSGVFIDGKVRTAGGGASSGDRGLVIAADTILRRSADVMVLEDGVISSCDADDPHYAIKASRVWILGDKEWALSDAVFSLGNVPILWLPFFYYPGQEIVFHPVIGYRSREGRFLQTTVYLVGAKPAKKDTTSILSFKDSGQASLTELKGLFLRKVSGPPPKDIGTLKTMADVYSGLGYFAGVQGSFPKLSLLDRTDFFAGIGYSRSLFPLSSGIYSPFIAAGDWSSVWNSSDFLGKSLPFRYGLDLSTSLHAGSFLVNLALPLYSDPYFDQDFRNRSEDMDWLKILSTNTDTSTIPPLRMQLAPKLDTSLSLKPKFLSPWLMSIDIPHLGASMLLLSKSAALTEDPALAFYDPRQQFFFPSVFRPIDLSASIKGSLFGTGAAPAAPVPVPIPVPVPAPVPVPTAPVPTPTPTPTPTAVVAPATAAAGTASELRSPWAEAEGGDDAAKKTAGAQGAADLLATPAEAFRIPQRIPSPVPRKMDSWIGSASWNITPSMYYEDRYRSDSWNSPEGIDNSLLYSLMSYSLAASVDSSANYGDLLASSLSITYADQDQSRPYLYDDGSGSAATYTLADELYKNRRLGGSAKLTFKPFASSWLWSGSTLGWNMDSTIYGFKYDSTTSAFADSWLSWDPAVITSHNLSLNLAVRPNNLVQSLSLVASLPPTLESYSSSLSLNAGLASISIQSRMYRKTAGADFSFDPISTSLAIGASPGPVLADSFVYDAADVGAVTNTSSLAWGPFSSSLTALRTTAFKPVVGSGWVAYGDPAFALSGLTMSLKPQLKSAAGARAEWSLAPDLELTQGLVRFTESSLSFGLTASLKVGDELSLSISSLSQNSSVWRYYSGLFSSTPIYLNNGPNSSYVSPSAYQRDPLKDIWDSLSIWDQKALANSLFKLKSLSFSAARDLHDWTLTVGATTTPIYNGSTYKLNTALSILIAWKDLSEIKSTITYNSTPVPPATSLTY